MDKPVLEVVHEGIKDLYEAELMDKQQFDELLASVKEMDEIVFAEKTALEKVGKTDWERLSEMKDEQIDMTDIAELDDELFKEAKLIQSQKDIKG